VMDYKRAHLYAAILLLLSFVVLLAVYLFNQRQKHKAGIL